MSKLFSRPVLKTLIRRLTEPRRFIQVLAGPRQTGKTTLARQAVDALKLPAHVASADEPSPGDRQWLARQWELGRKAVEGARRGGLLILDEVQKIPRWSEVVKRHWDEDTARGVPLKVLLLGSSPWLVQRGLTESLAGRFETLPVTHWSFGEMRGAFGWDLERHLHYGGYPGGASLVDDPPRWRRHILDALVETTLSRDILLMTRVDKPALLRQVFRLACDYSGQIFSYQKMLGQLQDAGNTTTAAHYLELLSGAGLVTGLPKIQGNRRRQRASSPKLQVLNTALMTAVSEVTPEAAAADPALRGRLVESAVGAHLANEARAAGAELGYWRDRIWEVDFVVRMSRRLIAIEVKSGKRRREGAGLAAFHDAYPASRTLVVGTGGIPLEEFLETPLDGIL